MPESHLLTPTDALKAALDGFDGPIIFVDDFAGSGDQFLSTWRRRHEIIGHGRYAFSDLPIKENQLFVYCNAILTEHGRGIISSACPTLVLATGNLIPETYNWTSSTSILWPKDEQAQGIDFIRRVSATLGLGDDNGGERDWRGYHKLGLGIAFEHSTPDATLPIFHWSEGWNPLVRRL
jgi:hypothetical protein